MSDPVLSIRGLSRTYKSGDKPSLISRIGRRLKSLVGG